MVDIRLNDLRADNKAVGIFDSHAHYDDEQFDADRDELFAGFGATTVRECTAADRQAAAEGYLAEAEGSELPSVPHAGVAGIVNVGASVHGSLESVAMAHRYPFIYAAVGVHPDEAGELLYYSRIEAGAEKGAAETAGAERGAAEAAGTEKGAAEAAGAERGAAETAGAEQGAAEAAGAEKRAAETAGAERGAAEAAGAEKRAAEAAGAEQNGRPSQLTPAVCANNFSLIEALARDDKTVAVGEIGLDYHWNVWPKELQREVFRKQWELAFEVNKPVIIHSRDAAEDTMTLVRELYQRAQRENREFKAVMHCYSYSPEQAREYLAMGLYFGIGGVITFKNSKKLKETVAELPLDKILLETDCPYLAPEPFRGSRNNSGYLTRVAEKIAEIKGISVREVYEATYANACRFFGLRE